MANHNKITQETFWSSVDKLDNGCWEWSRYREQDGYGMTSINRKRFRTHRLAYIYTYGEIPDGLLVCHRCDNPPCCNPDHLFLGSNKDNIRDMVRKGRRSEASGRYERTGQTRGSQNGMAKITERDVLEIRYLYDVEKMTQISIANLFNVSCNNVSLIVQRKTWRHVA